MDEESINILKNQLAALEGGLKGIIKDFADLPADRSVSQPEVKTNLTVIDGLYEQACTTLLKLEGYSRESILKCAGTYFPATIKQGRSSSANRAAQI